MKIIITAIFLILSLFCCSVHANNQQASTTSGCGNGVIETGEDCDGADLGGQTCVGLGYASGTLSCNSNCTFNTSNCVTASTPPPSGGGGGGGGGGYVATPKETKVILKGKAYPDAEIIILKDGKTTTSVSVDSQANFRKELTGLTAGTYTFGVWGEDKAGRKSITFSFTSSVKKGTTTTISDIFLPPTIELEKSKLKRGEILNIFGSTVPESEVSVYIESQNKIIRKIDADNFGNWEHFFDTGILDAGTHTTRAKSVSPNGLLSTYSNTLAFVVGKDETIALMNNGDISADKKINLIDFSILFYNWGTPENSAADLNTDGKVNLTDFSIMMYHWTG